MLCRVRGRAGHAFNFDSFLGTGLCRSGKPPMTRLEEGKYDMLETTIAGSLPKPAWLAKPRMLWAPWQFEGEALVEAKRDATLLALKEQEDAGIDIITDGEQARQHFVHGFLERIEGVDFARRVTMGIRNNRYNAEVPTVTGPLRRKSNVHGFEARIGPPIRDAGSNSPCRDQ
jgi:hypothetical protein